MAFKQTNKSKQSRHISSDVKSCNNGAMRYYGNAAEWFSMTELLILSIIILPKSEATKRIIR